MTDRDDKQKNDQELHSDQVEALDAINTFLKNSEQHVFILTGTTNSGKSFLIHDIQERAKEIGIKETKIFASSSRVANNLLDESQGESLYHHIYGGISNDDENYPNDDAAANILDDSFIEVVPLRNCGDSDNTLFVVDEAQLVSDSFYQSLDAIYGTGRLLNDFLTFSNLLQSERKIIFIGDQFQLQMGDTDKNSLNPQYLENEYKLKTSGHQLRDNPEFSRINKDALVCVDGIRKNNFNQLHLDTCPSVCLLTEEESLSAMKDNIGNKVDCHILSYTNAESQRINYQIKEAIIKNGKDIAVGDLIMFNNNILVDDIDNSSTIPKKILNGWFATVIKVSDIINEPVNFTKKSKLILINLQFREIIISISGQQFNIISLENYRLNAKAELSKDEVIAFKRYLGDLLRKQLSPFLSEINPEYLDIKKSKDYCLFESMVGELEEKIKNGERVKSKLEELVSKKNKIIKDYKKKCRSKIKLDRTGDYYKFKNVALLRYGWAMTVHKSMSYKWDEVIFNVDTGDGRGRNNESHFRWLYTGISRAKNKISLINYSPITPFDKTKLVDNNSGLKPMEDVRHEIVKFDFSVINDDWRKKQYEQFCNFKFQFDAIAQSNYRDRIKLHDNNDELEIEVDYKGDSSFSKITAKYYSNSIIWENFKKAVDQIKS